MRRIRSACCAPAQLELGWLFDRKVAHLGASENSVNVVGHTPSQIEEPYAVGHQAACQYKLTYFRDRRELVSKRQPSHLRPVGRIGMGSVEQQHANTVLLHRGKYSFQVLWTLDRVRAEVQSERLGRVPRFAQGGHACWVRRIDEVAHTAEPRQRLLRQFRPFPT